jgi:N6-adenosine-specific RNA methylase IME4
MYKVIVSDPAWKTVKGGKKAARPKSSGMAPDYSLISLEEIMAIQQAARDLAEPDHVLFMWTIDKYLHEAETMGKSLGYKLHARMIWNKVNGIPAAFTIRFGHEYLLWFYHGKFSPVAKDMRGKIHSVFTEKARRHSQKPEISYHIIEQLFPAVSKLELFARGKARPNYDIWGNQAENSITLSYGSGVAGNAFENATLLSADKNPHDTGNL